MNSNNKLLKEKLQKDGYSKEITLKILEFYNHQDKCGRSTQE
jgi:hypothetical protein